MVAGKVFMTEVMLVNLKNKSPLMNVELDPVIQCELDPCACRLRKIQKMQSDWKRVRLERLHLILAAGTKTLCSFPKGKRAALEDNCFMHQHSYLWCYLNKCGHGQPQTSSEKTSVSYLWLKELTLKDEVLKKLCLSVEFNEKNIF